MVGRIYFVRHRLGTFGTDEVLAGKQIQEKFVCSVSHSVCCWRVDFLSWHRKYCRWDQSDLHVTLADEK